MCSRKVRLETYHEKANRKYLNAYHRNHGVFEDKTRNALINDVNPESEINVRSSERPFQKGWDVLASCLEEMGISKGKIKEIDSFTSKAWKRDSFSGLIVKAIEDFNITKDGIEQTDDLSICIKEEVHAYENLLCSIYLERSISYEIEAGKCFGLVSRVDDEKTLLRLTKVMGEYVLQHPDCWHFLWNNTRDNINRLVDHYSNHQLDYIYERMKEIDDEKERKLKEREKRMRLEKTFSNQNVPHDIRIRFLHVIDKLAAAEEKEMLAERINYQIQECHDRDAYMALVKAFEDA